MTSRPRRNRFVGSSNFLPDPCSVYDQYTHPDTVRESIHAISSVAHRNLGRPLQFEDFNAFDQSWIRYVADLVDTDVLSIFEIQGRRSGTSVPPLTTNSINQPTTDATVDDDADNSRLEPYNLPSAWNNPHENASGDWSKESDPTSYLDDDEWELSTNPWIVGTGEIFDPKPSLSDVQYSSRNHSLASDTNQQEPAIAQRSVGDTFEATVQELPSDQDDFQLSFLDDPMFDTFINDWNNIAAKDLSDKAQEQGHKACKVDGEVSSTESANQGQASGKRRKRLQRLQGETKRRQTQQTREVGSCPRCHMRNKLCVPVDENDPSGYCKNCEKDGKSLGRAVPCVRVKLSQIRLTDIPKQLSKDLLAKLKKRCRTEYKGWRRIEDAVHITVTHRQLGLGEPFELIVQMLERKMPETNAGPMISFIAQTPRMLRQLSLGHDKEALDKIKETIAEFLGKNTQAYMDLCINHRDELLLKTYRVAIDEVSIPRPTNGGSGNFPKPSPEYVRGDRIAASEKVLYPKVLYCIFQMRTALHWLNDLELDDEDGMQVQIQASTSELATSLVRSELKDVLEAIISKAETEIRRSFENLTNKNRKGNWFVLYLAILLLLHHYGVWATRCHARLQEASPEDASETMSTLQKIRDDAQALLLHFRLCVEETKFRPLTADWTDPRQIQASQLNERQAEFMGRSIELGKQLSRNKSAQINAYYFIAQLFES